MLANQAPAPNDDSPQGDSDYHTILAALLETARGRSFLEEFALRSRSTETATLLTAIARIEGLLQTRSLEPGPAAEAPQAAPEPSAADATAADIAEIEETSADLTAIAVAEIEVTIGTVPAHDVAAIAASRVVVSDGYHAQVGTAAIELPGIDFVDDDEAEAGEPSAGIPVPTSDEPPVVRDPFADIRALSDEEKIALFT